MKIHVSVSHNRTINSWPIVYAVIYENIISYLAATRAVDLVTQALCQ
jgi:hypothetical protein